jgi:hypothetical protein
MLLSKFQINLYTHVFKKQQVNTHNPSSCGAGTAYPSEAPEFAPHVFVLITLVFCVLFYRPLFVLITLVFCLLFYRPLFVLITLVFCVLFYRPLFVLITLVFCVLFYRPLFVLITLVFCVLFYRPLFVIFLLALPLWYAFFYTHEAYSQS